MTEHHPHGEARGILYVGGAYVFWGLVPLYWNLLAGVSVVQVATHRILWCAVFVVAVTFARGRFSRIVSIVRTPRLIAALVASSLLIGANWTIFIYCVATHQLIDASLGYYITPLLSIGLGVALLKERVSPIRLLAIGLAVIAVAIETIGLGHIPWVAPALALSFGFYGYVRKLTPVDGLDGVAIETLLLLPLALLLVVVWAVHGTGAFGMSSPGRDALLVVTGPLTALPLAMFAAGARQIRMTTLGFLQYISPSITLVVATLLLGEPFTPTSAVAFGCIWSALVLVSLEGRVPLLTRRVAE